ncbi:hypothetical protein SDC9_74379 [bioreactor metagenome]|uniref:Uncharacterized protein n=1 Tax=bioreactor metagenome TaxID=1076179 RepID=A0A644YP40_9ZZZZ
MIEEKAAGKRFLTDKTGLTQNIVEGRLNDCAIYCSSRLDIIQPVEQSLQVLYGCAAGLDIR